MNTSSSQELNQSIEETDNLLVKFRESLGDTLVNSVSITRNPNMNFSLRSMNTNNIDTDSIEVNSILEKYSDKLLELVNDKILQKINR